jgi:1,4-dihydroxy-2-naphthoate polyprenyltransferase
MSNELPNFAQMIRAGFLSSIIAPLLAGSFIAAHINDTFNPLTFLLVMIMGLALHIATNVYNDIYDTLQGNDTVNIHRNEFSGGSGIIVNHPQLQSTMFTIARLSLIVALLAAVVLTALIPRYLWPHLWGLYILSAFFAKYYTAAPVKLAYRGWGEISVWFAFGPMAILIAAIGQGVAFHPAILAAMPATGLSTLSILLLGQLIDLQADELATKWGVAVRVGTRFTACLFIFIHILIILNMGWLSMFFMDFGKIFWIVWLPYLFVLPSLTRNVLKFHDDPKKLKSAAKSNVKLHLLFFLLYAVSSLLLFLL